MITFSPDFSSFAEIYAAAAPQSLFGRWLCDTQTPIGAYLNLKKAFPGPSVFLESVEGGALRGRYSAICFAPDLVWRAQDGKAWIKIEDGAFTEEDLTPLASLRRLIQASALPLPEGLPSMSHGLFGFLGYDMIRQMEALPSEKPSPINLPDSLFIRPKIVVIFDSLKDEVLIVTPQRPDASSSSSAQKAYDAAKETIMRVARTIFSPVDFSLSCEDQNAARASILPRSNVTPEAFQKMTRRAIDYIRQGDAFQIVLSQRFSTPFTHPPFAMYRALRRVNPSPYLSYLDFEDFQIACSSPEILVKSHQGEITIRPLAGTRPRGATPRKDLELEIDLLNDAKERAEHLMLLDLGRNDVGRVARPGSVTVTGSFMVERYSHVMHIVSNVTGKIAEGHDALDCLIAGFPAGTVSGAPKVRAMQIIDELEPEKRGPYAGCIGYFSANGDMDTCITLRTAIFQNGVMFVQAGAGVVADSDPQKEYEESVNKAKALFKAAEDAVFFA